MYYYKTKLRLNGSINNEVQKIVSAPEFMILQLVHGTDALTDVREIRNEKISLGAEKEKLRLTYTKPLARKKQSIDGIFGALGQVPERLPENLLERYGIDEEGLVMAEVKHDITEEDVIDVAQKSSKKIPFKKIVEAERLTKFTPAEEVNLGDLME